jgi:hypothetical protein
VLSIQWPDEEEEDEEELFFCFSNRFCLLNPLPGNSSLAPNVEKERRQKTKNKKMFSKCFVPLTIVALAVVALGKFKSKFFKILFSLNLIITFEFDFSISWPP